MSTPIIIRVAKTGDTEITIRVPGIRKIKMDEKVRLKFNPEMANLSGRESGNLNTF